MRLLRITAFGLACGVIAACSHDTGASVTPIPPLTYVRYVHAMPDTGQVDVHLVDSVENLNFGDPVTGQTPYRQISGYTGIGAGSRHFRVFTDMQSTDITVVSQVILDTTVTLAANTYYTILHTGYARASQNPHQHFVVIQDAVPTPSTSQVAIRAIVAAPGIGPVDIYAPATTSAALPASPVFTGVVYGTPTAWINFAPSASLAFRAVATGTTAPMLAQLAVPAGAAQQTYLDPVAGISQGGTALTAFVFPAGVPGSPNGNVAASIGWGIDRRPPRQ